MLHHPSILGGHQQMGQNQSGPKRGRKCYITPAFSGSPNKGDKIEAGPKRGGNATSPLHCRGSPTKGTKSKWAQKRAQNATSPQHSRGAPTKGTKSNQAQIAENCGKIAEKLRENCDVVSGPPEPSRCYSFGQVAQNSENFTETNSPWTVQLQEAPLDITVELQHEPKAADVVIQFVLPL